MMKGEFQIPEDAQVPPLTGLVAKPYIPKFHRIVRGDKEGLLPPDTPVNALVCTVGKAVAAGIAGSLGIGGVQGLSHRLPGQGPVIPAVVIPDIDIVAGPVHGHPVGPEPGNPVVFRGFIKKIAPGGMVKHPAHIPDTDIISPGNRHIDPVYHVFPVFIVKISVLHGRCLSFILMVSLYYPR
jgi:hypothetical protein